MAMCRNNPKSMHEHGSRACDHLQAVNSQGWGLDPRQINMLNSALSQGAIARFTFTYIDVQCIYICANGMFLTLSCKHPS